MLIITGTGVLADFGIGLKRNEFYCNSKGKNLFLLIMSLLEGITNGDLNEN
jgi:hypothetical protein